MTVVLFVSGVSVGLCGPFVCFRKGYSVAHFSRDLTPTPGRYGGSFGLQCFWKPCFLARFGAPSFTAEGFSTA